jgi:hypothetical protein
MCTHFTDCTDLFRSGGKKVKFVWKIKKIFVYLYILNSLK